MTRLADVAEELDREASRKRALANDARTVLERYPDATTDNEEAPRYVSINALKDAAGVEARFDEHEGSFGSFVLEPYAIVKRGDREIRVYAGVRLTEGRDRKETSNVPREISAFFEDFCARPAEEQAGFVAAVVDAIAATTCSSRG